MRLSLGDLQEVNGLVARLVALRREADAPTSSLGVYILSIERRLAELGVDPGKTIWGAAKGAPGLRPAPFHGPTAHDARVCR